MPKIGSKSNHTPVTAGATVGSAADVSPGPNTIGFEPALPAAQSNSSGAALKLSPGDDGAFALAIPQSSAAPDASQTDSPTAFARKTLSTFWKMFKGEGAEKGQASRRHVLAQRSGVLGRKLSEARAANDRAQIRKLTRQLVDVEYEAAGYARSPEDKLSHLERCIETYFDTYGFRGGDQPKRMLEVVYLAHGLYLERATGLRTVRTTDANNQVKFVCRGQRKPPEEVDMLAYFRSRTMLMFAHEYMRSTDSRFRLHTNDEARLDDVYPWPENNRFPMGQSVSRDDLKSWDLLDVLDRHKPVGEWATYSRWDDSGKFRPFIQTVFQAAWNRAAETQALESLQEMPKDLVEMVIDQLEDPEASQPPSDVPALDDPPA